MAVYTNNIRLWREPVANVRYIADVDRGVSDSFDRQIV